jgi:hypothetical protein
VRRTTEKDPTSGLSVRRTTEKDAALGLNERRNTEKDPALGLSVRRNTEKDSTLGLNVRRSTEKDSTLGLDGATLDQKLLCGAFVREERFPIYPSSEGSDVAALDVIVSLRIMSISSGGERTPSKTCQCRLRQQRFERYVRQLAACLG